VWQFDVAPDAATAGFFRPAVCRFHDAGTTTGHDGETHVTGRRTHLAGELVVRVVLSHPGRSEDGDAGPGEMESAKATEHLSGDAKDRAEFTTTKPGTAEEETITRRS
jgi:hypothetical protein